MNLRIEELLTQKGLNKSRFAELMGIRNQNVNALLKNPTVATLEKISGVLDVPIWQLFAPPCAPSGDIDAMVDYQGHLYHFTTVAGLKAFTDSL